MASRIAYIGLKNCLMQCVVVSRWLGMVHLTRFMVTFCAQGRDPGFIVLFSFRCRGDRFVVSPKLASRKATKRRIKRS